MEELNKICCAVFENAAEGILVVDSDIGLFVMANPLMAEVHRLQFPVCRSQFTVV